MVAEVAGLLKLNQQTVRNWIDRGFLKAFHVGGGCGSSAQTWTSCSSGAGSSHRPRRILAIGERQGVLERGRVRLALIAAGDEVRAALLRPREPRLLGLRVAGYTRDEIAERAGDTYRTVARQLGRAQRNLKSARPTQARVSDRRERVRAAQPWRRSCAPRTCRATRWGAAAPSFAGATAR